MSDEQEFATGGALPGSWTWELPEFDRCMLPPPGWQYRGELATDDSRCGVDYASTITINLDNERAMFIPTGRRIEYGRAQPTTTDDNAGGQA